MYLPLLLTFLYLLPLNISPSCLSSVVFPLLAALPLINSFACFPSLLSRNCLSFIFLILLHLLLILLFLSSSPTIVTFSSFFIYFLSSFPSPCLTVHIWISPFRTSSYSSIHSFHHYSLPIFRIHFLLYLLIYILSLTPVPTSSFNSSSSPSSPHITLFSLFFASSI